MNLKELITYIMTNYDTTKQFKDNVVANKVRHGIDDAISLKNNERDRFKFKGSAGQGRFAEIPWIGIFDTNHYEIKAERGIYLVYLFSADRKKTYLSLIQGWTHFENKYGVDKAEQNVKKITKRIRQFIEDKRLDNISDAKTNMDLASSNPKAIGYKSVNILSLEYNIDSMPSNNKMENDLFHMIDILQAVNDSKEIQSFISEYYKKINESKNNKKKNGTIKTPTLNSTPSNNNTSKTVPLRVEQPHLTKKGKPSYSGKTVKKDYELSYKNNKALGEKGEELVFQLEKKRLIDENHMELADKVKWVSKTEGDGLGYDIESYIYDENKDNINQMKIYIEVKTTKERGKLSRFPVTYNEVLASEKYQDRYYIYRVFNYSEDKPFYYSINGDLNNVLHLDPMQYYGYPK